jgi:crotonobetainyl-CoA:carnitine CoA-transferase CaiB-like acyl-CoA transferase
VLDLTLARAGPTCVRQLADLGADVIRISAPGRPDLLSGSDAQNLHRDKRSLLLDLKDARGHAVFLKLATSADVLVENFRSEVKHRLRIDYDTLAQRNPRLVYGSISGFGQDGPYGNRAGVDQIAQGLSGLMSVTGPPNSGPWRTGIAISDTAAGTFLAQAIVAALFERERSGRGQWVHTSLLESLVNFMDFQATRWLTDGVVPKQAGNDHPSVFPMGTFRAGDGFLNIAPALDWEAFCRALGSDALPADERFASFELRMQNKEALRAAIEAILADRSVAEWVEIINAGGVPCGPVLAIDEAMADPQVRHLDMTQQIEHASEGPVTLLRYPASFAGRRPAIERAAPLPGSDTRAVLEEAGCGPEEIEALLAAGVARDAPAP